MNNTTRIGLIFLLILANFGFDQFSKDFARKEIGSYETILILGEYLVLDRVQNAGAFLSAGEDVNGTVKFIILGALPLGLLCFGLSYLILQHKLPKLLVFGMCFVIGGGFGNLFDRFRYGAVTDFIYIDLPAFKSGIFNLADVSIMIGMLLLSFHLYYKHSRSSIEATENFA